MKTTVRPSNITPFLYLTCAFLLAISILGRMSSAHDPIWMAGQTALVCACLMEDRLFHRLWGIATLLATMGLISWGVA